jgi:glutamine amidotransferase
MITIIDYGVGNLSSIENMLRKVGVLSKVSKDPDEIIRSTKLILPGVGAFDTAMKKINDQGLYTAIREVASNGIFILGICLGAQLLMERSEEGVLQGLSLVKGRCKKFDEMVIAPLRIPHMGWSDVHFVNQSHPLAKFEETMPRFYFTHSFHLQCDDPTNKLATARYGHEFTCGVVKENVMGVQFHPEKSHKFGAQLLSNFAAM